MPSPAIATRLNKTLELGVEYVLTGVINQTGKVMRMNMCYWHKKMEGHVNRRQERVIRQVLQQRQ